MMTVTRRDYNAHGPAAKASPICSDDIQSVTEATKGRRVIALSLPRTNEIGVKGNYTLVSDSTAPTRCSNEAARVHDARQRRCESVWQRPDWLQLSAIETPL
jgi:hypothetical protein